MKYFLKALFQITHLASKDLMLAALVAIALDKKFDGMTLKIAFIAFLLTFLMELINLIIKDKE